eukprot:126297-Pelagomonas_calceolata.AAC.9
MPSHSCSPNTWTLIVGVLYHAHTTLADLLRANFHEPCPLTSSLRCTKWSLKCWPYQHDSKEWQASGCFMCAVLIQSGFLCCCACLHAIICNESLLDLGEV